MKKPLFLIGLALGLLSFAPPTQAVGEVCGDGTNNCCTAPAIVEEGGGCGPTRAWIGAEATGSCQEPPASNYPCGTSFRCSTNSCTSAGGGPACPGNTVNLGGGVCAPKLTVFQDTVTTTLAKLWNGDILGRMVYVADADCSDGEVPTWDNTAKEWVCGAGSGAWSLSGGDTVIETGNVGIGLNNPLVNLHISSLGDVGMWLEADTNNAGEDQNAYIKLTQDGGVDEAADDIFNTSAGPDGIHGHQLGAIFGLVGNTGDSPESENSYTGTIGNSTLLGTTNSKYNDNSYHLQFGTDDTVRMTILNTGEIGIGDTSPSAALDVNGSTRAGYDTNTTSYFGRAAVGYNPAYSDYAAFGHIDQNVAGGYALLQHNGGTTYLNSGTGTNLNFREGNSTKMKLIPGVIPDLTMLRSDSSTNSGDTLGAIGFASTDGGEPAGASNASALIMSTATINHSSTAKGGDLRFFTKFSNSGSTTNPVERMRIHNGGQVTINSTATDAHFIVDAPNLSTPLRIREAGTTRLMVKGDGNTSLNDNQLQDVLAIQLQDWDDNTGGDDDKYRLLARDGAWQFYNGGVVVGNKSNGTWPSGSEWGAGKLLVEGQLLVGDDSVSPQAELHIVDDDSGDQHSLIIDSDGETSDVPFMIRVHDNIAGNLDTEDHASFVVRGNGRVAIGASAGREDPGALLHLNQWATGNNTWDDVGIKLDNTCSPTPETVCQGASTNSSDAGEVAVAFRGYVNDYCPPGSTCAVNVTNSDWWIMGLNETNRFTWHHGTDMTNSTELMRLAPNGDLFVQNDITAYEDMFVDDSLVVGDEAHWRRDNLGANTLWKTYASDNADGDTFVWNSVGAGQVRMYLKENGDLIIDGAYNPWSDARLKEDVRTVDSALDKVEQLRGVYYKWNHKDHDKGDHLGVIAQEVKEVLPELVVGTGEMMEFDGGMEMDYYRMDYDGLSALLIEAVKEQQDLIERLNDRVEELEANVK